MPSLLSFKSNKRDDKSLTPLGSSAKWRKNKLDTLAKLIAINDHEFYSTTGRIDPKFWQIDESPKPKIPDKVLTQINKSSLLRLCEEQPRVSLNKDM